MNDIKMEKIDGALKKMLRDFERNPRVPGRAWTGKHESDAGDIGLKTAQLTTTIDVRFSVEEFIPYRQGKVKL